MTAHLWLKMLTDLKDNYKFKNIPFTLMQDIAKTPKAKIESFLNEWK
jgi:DNA polymerase-3 subunit epsilon